MLGKEEITVETGLVVKRIDKRVEIVTQDVFES